MSKKRPSASGRGKPAAKSKSPATAAANTSGPRQGVSTAIEAPEPKARGSFLGDALSIARYHIMAVAMVAMVVFSWLMTRNYYVALAAVVGLDWFFINLLNRVTDIDEDLKNGIPGTERVARQKKLLTVLSFGAMLASFVLLHLVWPTLTPWRLAVQLIGLGYNYKIVPTPRGLSRFKEIYFLKNFGSSVLFVLTCFVYPIAIDPSAVIEAPNYVMVLVVFFIPFELTYEILYDLRDLEGDRAEGVPTYPVVHGPEEAVSIINGLLLSSALILVGGLAMGWIGLREGLMILAPAVQFVFYRPRYRRGLTTPDCVWLTHLGTGLLLFFLLGTALWERAGMPHNIFLR